MLYRASPPLHNGAMFAVRRPRRNHRMICLTLTAALSWAGAAAATESGLRLPRFASLRAGEVNVRTGPGVRYPVEWVFVYQHMPVEIVAEFDAWRRVRDWEGTEGWVHKSMLSGRRSIIVTDGQHPMRQKPAPAAPRVAEVEERVIGRLLECKKDWCRVEITGMRGWMRRQNLWGSVELETLE